MTGQKSRSGSESGLRYLVGRLGGATKPCAPAFPWSRTETAPVIGAVVAALVRYRGGLS